MRGLICIVSLLAAGCHFGLRSRNYPPSTTGNGIAVTLRARAPSGDPSSASVRTLRGNLLAFTDTSLLLIVPPNLAVADERVILVSGQLLSVSFQRIGNYSALSTIPATQRERIRLSSQFPQGMSPELANRVLDTYGQAELTVWTGTTDRRIPRGRLADIFLSNTRDDGAAIDAFIASARAGSERFHDRTQAIREGYRRVGGDFPFMGEHWVHPSLVVDGLLSADKPAVLSYAMRGGAPVLLGVGYAAIGQPPHDFPTGSAQWHDHSGTVADAALSLHAKADTAMARGPRFFVLHAWVWMSNPGGLFTTDNLALPFVRAGLEPPPQIEPSAASALSLVRGGDAFYASVLTQAAGSNAAETRWVEDAIAHARLQVEEWHRQIGGGALPDREQLVRLTSIWHTLSSTLLTVLAPLQAERLKPYLLVDHHETGPTRR